MLNTTEIPPSEQTGECHLYHLCREAHVGDFTKGYIGISKDTTTRWERHKGGYSGSKIVNNAYKKHNDIVETIILTSSVEACKYMEFMLRPEPRMGWNIAAGGGLPPNLAGKVMSEEQKSKIGISNGGSNNYKWKGYWQVDGVCYESMTKAAKAIGCCKKSVRDRVLSSDYPNYRFIPAAEAATQHLGQTDD